MPYFSSDASIGEKCRREFNQFLSTPTFQTLNYADRAFWVAHFDAELEELKERLTQQTITKQVLKTRLEELQGIIGKLTLAPSVYDTGIQELKTFVTTLRMARAIRRGYQKSLTQVRIRFKQALQVQPAFTLENLTVEILQLLDQLKQKEIEASDMLMVLHYYEGTVDNDFYQQLQHCLKVFIKRLATLKSPSALLAVYTDIYQNLGQLVIEVHQRLGIIEELKKTWPAVFSSKEEGKPSSVETSAQVTKETLYGTMAQIFRGTLNMVQSTLRFALEHPAQAITSILATQVAATAALKAVAPLVLAESGRLDKTQPQSKKSTGVTASLPLDILKQHDKQLAELAKISAIRNVAINAPKKTCANSCSKHHARFFHQRDVNQEFQVNNYTSGYQGNPAIAALSNGDFVVTWQSNGQDGSGSGVYGQVFNTFGDSVGLEFRVNTDVTNDQHGPAIAALSNGHFMVTWQSNEQDGLGSGVYGQVFNASGTKIGSEFRVNTYTIDSQWLPVVTALDNSHFVTTWISFGQDGSDYGVYGQVFDEAGNPVGNEFRVNNYTIGYQGGPAIVALNNNSHFVVTWHSHEQDGSGYGVYGQVFDGTGNPLGHEFKVNNYTLGNQAGSAMAALSNGHFVVTWGSDGQDDSGYGVYGQVFDETGNPVSHEFRVNNYTMSNQADPAMAALSNGHFVVTWGSDGQDGSGYGVYGQVFDATGGKIGLEFRINTYIASDQIDPTVATLSNGRFAVTWGSGGQDGSGYGIVGKIIDTQLKATNTHQLGNYVENNNATLTPIVIMPPVFIQDVSITLILSDPTAGHLNIGTSGNVTANYDNTTGTWQASGHVEAVNALLANLEFAPTSNYNSNFTISVSIDDQFNPPLIDRISMIGHPAPRLTTDSFTTQTSTTPSFTTGSLTTTLQSHETSGETTTMTVTSQSLTSGFFLTTNIEEIPSSHQPYSYSNTGVIVGGLVGGLVALVTVTGLGFFARHQCKNPPQSGSARPTLLELEETRPAQQTALVPDVLIVPAPQPSSHQEALLSQSTMARSTRIAAK